MLKKIMEKNNFFVAIIAFAVIVAFFVLSAFAAVPVKYPNIEVTIAVYSESNKLIEGAKIENSHNAYITDSFGKAELSLDSPDILKISCDSYIADVVAVGYESNKKEIKVTLLSNKNRVVMNFGGDAMFGRRFEEIYKSGKQAKDIVANISKIFSIGDFQTINLESCIGYLPESDAVKGKRYILQSPVDTIDALKELNISLVSLANNHIRDWGDLGVKNTINYLNDAGIKHVGAGTYKEAYEPKIITSNGIRIGSLAYSSLTGSIINNILPDNSDIKPNNVSVENEWLWNKKTWSWSSENWNVPIDMYRPGEIWKRYAAIKKELSDAEIASIESNLELNFTGLQFWVVGEERLGAAQLKIKKAQTQIEDLRKNSDIVVVQLHSGYQYSTAPSEYLVSSAHACIDAGADIVIAHHSHVLQGMEWYKGHLIVYSLGNIVFDQNFLSTYASGILRTVWENNQLIQAKFVPIEIVDYIPKPVTDVSARNITRRIWEKSTLSTVLTKQSYETKVRQLEKGIDSEPVSFKFEQGSVYLTKETKETKQNISIGSNQITQLDDRFLWPANMDVKDGFKPGSLYIGRDLFGWGHFEDTLADNIVSGSTHFMIDGEKNKQWLCEKDASNGKNGFIRLSTEIKNSQDKLLRPVSCIPITNRFVDNEYLGPSSTRPFSVLASVRGEVGTHFYLRVDLYNYDDKNVLEDPKSEILQSKEYPVEIKGKGWNDVEIELDIPDTINEKKANMTMVYFVLKSSDIAYGSLDIDDFEFVQWNDVAYMPHVYGSYSQLKNKGGNIELGVSVLGE